MHTAQLVRIAFLFLLTMSLGLPSSVAEPEPQRARDVTTRFPGVPTFRDHRYILDGNAAAVAIATPSPSHFDIAKACHHGQRIGCKTHPKSLDRLQEVVRESGTNFTVDSERTNPLWDRGGMMRTGIKLTVAALLLACIPFGDHAFGWQSSPARTNGGVEHAIREGSILESKR